MDIPKEELIKKYAGEASLSLVSLRGNFLQ